MNDVKRALTRKLGPLPAWAWAIVAAGAIYYYRNKTGAAAQAAASTTPVTAPNVTDTTGTGNGSGSTPQAPIPLAPGESVYDPNTGQLIGGAGAPNANGDLATAIGDLTAALENGQTGATGPSTAPATSASHPASTPHKSSPATAHAKGHSSRYVGPGKFVGGKVGFNPRKAGLKAVGHSQRYTGPGMYKRVVKPKVKTAVAKVKPARGRAPVATHPNTTRNRTGGVAPSRDVRSRSVQTAAAMPGRRARPTVSVVGGPAPTQRPAATHPVAHPPAAPPKPRPPRRKAR